MDEDQQILNLLKFNQDQLNKLTSDTKDNIVHMEGLVKKGHDQMMEMDESISKSMTLLKKYGLGHIEVKKTTNEVEEDNPTVGVDVMTEAPSWEELVLQANQAGYEHTLIEDILTPEEIAKADQRYEEIEQEFARKTKLNKVDISFLLLATALQCARQYIFSNEKFRFNKAEDADKAIKDPLKKRVPKDWQDILFGSVPYDAVKRLDKSKDTGISANTHRYRTLGHDPILGWFFGPVNILSDSLTKSDFFTTYEVTNYQIGDPFPNGTWGAITTAQEVAQENKYNLPAAVIKQAIHFGTDYFTKQGLPIPFVSTLDNDLSKVLINQFNIDTYSVTRGATLSVLINTIISFIHRLFYDEKKYGSLEAFEVKTRKILLLSNAIATTSNVIYVALSKDLKKLDAGGILVTIYRLISDTRFISRVKEEFFQTKLQQDLQHELDYLDRVLG
ncbi:hypothetical protein [Neobacillus sp. D3-1R]|uniref:hypothetical protein n=1 Tax=Neobacillus sp. D3-1R TaxID=3445778 RepID=UPI003F9FDE58